MFLRLVLLLAGVLFLLPPRAYTQLTYTQSPDTLGDILVSSAKNVLESCQISWPPQLAKNQSDQQKNKNLVADADGLTAKIKGSIFKFDATVKPNVYDASYLRLLDSIGTTNPLETDDRLLHLAQLSEPSRLNLWGTDLVTYKLDCASVLSLALEAKAGFFIPIASLNAAFNASNSGSVKQSATMIRGSFQSPFNVFYNAEGQSPLKIFAAFRAIDWRGHTSTSGDVKYIASGEFLTLFKSTASAQTTSVFGDLKAGIAIPLVKVSGSVTGEFSRSMSLDAQSYSTYFWSPNEQSLPSYSALASTIANALGNFEVESTSIAAGVTRTAKSTITGWPAGLCSAGQWQLTSKNALYSPGGSVVMTPIPEPPSGGLPACSIELSFTLSPMYTTGDVSDPGLTLTWTGAAEVAIAVHPRALHPAGKPSLTLITSKADWSVQRDKDVERGYLLWTFPAHVDLADGRLVKSVDIDRTKFACKAGDASISDGDITDANAEGKVEGKVSLSGDVRDFTFGALLTLQGARKYNYDLNQPSKKNCKIIGTAVVVTADLAGGVEQKDTVTLSTGTINYPNDLPANPPPAPLNLTVTDGNTQVVLSWNGDSSATSFNVYRTVPGAARARINPLNSITKSTYQDTGLVNGATYTYEVTAVNAAGESEYSKPAAAHPLAPPNAPVNLRITSTDAGKVTLEWDASDGATSYSVYRSNSAGTEVKLDVTIKPATFTDAGLDSTKKYYYQITAVNAAGEGPRSGEVSGSPK